MTHVKRIQENNRHVLNLTKAKIKPGELRKLAKYIQKHTYMKMNTHTYKCKFTTKQQKPCSW